MKGLNAPSGAQCFPTCSAGSYVNAVGSQCTFWCSVLSDPRHMKTIVRNVRGLNAPSGAQCFPTGNQATGKPGATVSMHLLVLSAFRPRAEDVERVFQGTSQCTFWCSVLSDSMSSPRLERRASSLNAPSGAQRFPTILPHFSGVLIRPKGLNAPSGAQRFPTQ